VPGLTVGIEICEDMWVPVHPATEQGPGGAPAEPFRLK